MFYRKNLMEKAEQPLYQFCKLKTHTHMQIS